MNSASDLAPGFTFKTAPYEHQLRQFYRHRDSPYFALFNDMGTGKTKISIDIAAHKYLTGQINAVLLIAPNHVHEQWIKEQFPVHCSIPYRSVVYKSSKTTQKHWREYWNMFASEPMPYLKVLAVNVEAFQTASIEPFIAEYVQMNTVFTIIDEATRIKNHTAKRTKMIHKLQKYGQRAILTGTPTTKSPFDLWSMMEFLKHNYFNCNYFIFQNRYGVMMKGENPYGGKYTTLIDEKTYQIVKWKLNKLRESRNGELMPDDYEAVAAFTGVSEKNVRFIEHSAEFMRFKRLDEIKEYIAKDVSSVRKEDCLDLPEKIYETIVVDMSAEQQRVYDTLRKELLVEYDGKELSVQNKVALVTRLMQITGGFMPYFGERNVIIGTQHTVERTSEAELIGKSNVKLDALIADLDELADDAQVIIWAHFVSELKALYAELSKRYTACLYYGGTSDHDRETIKSDFIAGRYKLFIGNAQSAGFGLNLQVATYQYFFSNTFRTEERLQAEDRSHRIGVRTAVVYKDIVARGTVDEKIYQSIQSGRELNEFFKDTSLYDMLTPVKESDE